MRRLTVVLVAWVLVFGAAAAGSLSTTPAAEAQAAEPLCDTSRVEQFADVAAGDYGAGYVLCMRALGLSQGTGGGSYGPDRELNRGQMASFLVRLWRDVLGKDCPSGVVSPFTDVAAGSTHAANIECLYGLEITTGTGPDTYGPRDPLKATQISRFLYRVYTKAGGDVCSGTGGSELDRATECLLQLRVVPTSGEATSTGAVTRAQMGVYVVGLWHNLTGRGLPPPPPQLGTPTSVATTTTTQPATQSTPRIAYTVTTDDGTTQLRISDPDGANTTTIRLANGDRLQTTRWSPAGTRIAYAIDSDDGDQLWVADADGANPTKLTDNTDFFGGWGWSPAGTRIAYAIDSDDGDQLWVADADGANPTKLTDNTDFFGGWGWSPAGTRIAYAIDSDDGDQLWVADAGGANPTKVADNTDLTDRFRRWGWSPDGTRIAYAIDSRIAYAIDSDEGGELWVVGVDGSDPTKLADTPEGWSSWDVWVWSPDGSRIAYEVSTDNGGYQLWVVGADGSNPTKLTDSYYYTSLSWSPDGARMAYGVDTSGFTLVPDELWVVDADGANPTKLADTPGGLVVSGFGWSPDGARMAYMVNTADGGELWVVGVDGSDPTKLADTPEGWSSVDVSVWSPDGARLTHTADGLWVVGVDGSNPTRLGSHLTISGWSPDSTRIAYEVRTTRPDQFFGADDGGELWVVGVDGSNPTKLTDSLGRSVFPAVGPEQLVGRAWAWSDSTRGWSWLLGDVFGWG